MPPRLEAPHLSKRHYWEVFENSFVNILFLSLHESNITRTLGLSVDKQTKQTMRKAVIKEHFYHPPRPPQPLPPLTPLDSLWVKVETSKLAATKREIDNPNYGFVQK